VEDLSAGDLTSAGAENGESLRQLISALKRLPEPQRELLLLVAWDGLSVGEAAQVVGCSPTTARGRLHRGRHRLKTELAGKTEPRYTKIVEVRSNA
jgi:RNA polymerase sigma factor (sigma-70 family)